MGVEVPPLIRGIDRNTKLSIFTPFFLGEKKNTHITFNAKESL